MSTTSAPRWSNGEGEMTDMTDASILPGTRPDLPPPVTEAGVIGWLRYNLFSSWWDSLLTILAIYLLYLIVPAIVSWAFIDADWNFLPSVVSGEKQPQFADCTRGGACWIFVRARFGQFFYGFYPEGERWRVNIVLILLVASVYGLLSERIKHKKPIGIFFFGIFPILAFILLYGGLGLPIVPTQQWGGFMLTLTLAGIGILFSLPIGILLALGRRSQLPIIHLLSVLFIEFARGVPLITILFMANVMLPLFLPPGVEFNILLRVLIGVTLFASAYMAEVIRGGLQALHGPRLLVDDAPHHHAAGFARRHPGHRQQLYQPDAGYDAGRHRRPLRLSQYRTGRVARFQLDRYGNRRLRLLRLCLLDLLFCDVALQHADRTQTSNRP
jgi:general L-amino acid transport system permease protein